MNLNVIINYIKKLSIIDIITLITFIMTIINSIKISHNKSITIKYHIKEEYKKNRKEIVKELSNKRDIVNNVGYDRNDKNQIYDIINKINKFEKLFNLNQKKDLKNIYKILEKKPTEVNDCVLVNSINKILKILESEV